MEEAHDDFITKVDFHHSLDPLEKATTTSTKQLFENNSTTNKLFIILTPDLESSSFISSTQLILEPYLFL
jgi:hypothetical protein